MLNSIYEASRITTTPSKVVDWCPPWVTLECKGRSLRELDFSFFFLAPLFSEKLMPVERHFDGPGVDSAYDTPYRPNKFI